MNKKYVESSFTRFVKYKLNEIKKPNKKVDDDVDDDIIEDDDTIENGTTTGKTKFGEKETIKNLKAEFEAIMAQYPQY